MTRATLIAVCSQLTQPEAKGGQLHVTGEIGCIRQRATFKLVPYFRCHVLLDRCPNEKEKGLLRQIAKRLSDALQGCAGCFPMLVRAGWINSAFQLAQSQIKLI